MEREFSLNIKQTAGLYGVSADTLRYYEAIGLVAPKRGANAYRCLLYTSHTLDPSDAREEPEKLNINPPP